MNHAQYWKRKCDCHVANVMACGACDKCLDHCDCPKGKLELFEALARNALKRAQDGLLKEMKGVPRQDKPREGGQTVPDSGEPRRTRVKKKLRLGGYHPQGIQDKIERDS